MTDDDLYGAIAQIQDQLVELTRQVIDLAGHVHTLMRGLHDPLRTMPYDQYLGTDHWRDTRQSALDRAGHRCQLCGATAQLDVHHNTYDRRGHEHPTDLVVLCHACHERHHRG